MNGRGPTAAVCTIVRGRQEHLRRMLIGLSLQTRSPDRVVVAWMGGPDPSPAIPPGMAVDVVRVDDPAVTLPLARARNAARQAAGDVDIVVFLDVDVIPSTTLVADYVSRCDRDGGLWSGQVDYLPAGVPAGGSWTELELQDAATPHPARMAPHADVRLDDPALFWSLSFALRAADFDRIGGFDEGFIGYGGEDTDFGRRADRADLALWRTPFARAWHQHHTSQSPPVHHVTDIVRNARHFHQKWGDWPMGGWLREFAAQGLVTFEPDNGVLRET